MAPERHPVSGGFLQRRAACVVQQRRNHHLGRAGQPHHPALLLLPSDFSRGAPMFGCQRRHRHPGVCRRLPVASRHLTPLICSGGRGGRCSNVVARHELLDVVFQRQSRRCRSDQSGSLTLLPRHQFFELIPHCSSNGAKLRCTPKMQACQVRLLQTARVASLPPVLR